MTKYIYKDDKDKLLINNSFNNIAYLILGKNNKKRINILRKVFEEKVKRVCIIPQGNKTSRINEHVPGICYLDEASNKIIIEMLGFVNSKSNQALFIEHEGTHEFCHAIVDILSDDEFSAREGEIIDGVKCSNSMGLIKETDPETGEFVDNRFYNKMFNETMMDIISSMAINATKGRNIDDMLYKPYTAWNNATTGYSTFTSITRLAIAAFSNNPNANYSNISKSGEGIFDVETIMENGKSYKANDFLYGIVFDQLYIGRQFDKFMGKGYYRLLCHFLDRMFVNYKDSREINPSDVKVVMNVLADFLNKKYQYYVSNGIMKKENANKMISNFNVIWNSLQSEYSAFFTEEEIDEIAIRAGY